MSYWVYENWTAENKTVIHEGGCSFCKEGQGIHERKDEGRNGRWHGPCNTYQHARNLAQDLNRPIRNCNFCCPHM